MKIIKPLTLGVLHQPYRYRGQHRLAIAALGFFALGRGDERFLVDNLQWPRVLPMLPAGQPLDHVLPKARAEVMVSGIAHSPKPVERMQVRLQCGPVDKRLRVLGDRAWERTWWGGTCVCAPKPFQKMPLSLQNAYGGAGHDNPLGRGFLPRLWWLRMLGGAMPNIEYANAPAAPGRSSAIAAGFAPQSLMHAQRRMRASGTYDSRWLAEDFPGLPRDFDFSLYNVAPIDQQFRGRFAGGEAYRLEGMHPSGAAIAGTLPAMTMRAFVLPKGAAAGAAREVPLQCDTVWFFPEAGVGLMIQRGETVVEDSDALDIAALMLAYDAPGRARPLSHFHDVLALRLDPRTAALHAFNESQLAPVRSAQAQAEREAAKARQAAAAQARRQAVLDETMAEFWQRSGIAPPTGHVPPMAGAPALPALSAEELAECDFDLAEMHANAQAMADAARKDGEARLAEMKAVLPEAAEAPEKTVEALTEAAIARAVAPAYDLIGQLAPLPADLEKAFALAQGTAGAAVEPGKIAEVRQAISSLLPLQRAARAAAPEPVAMIAPSPDAVAQALGAKLIAMHRAGEPLAGHDFAGACLRGVDLRGADLREIQLERADLRNACLAGADLTSAALTRAQLDGADLTSATLAGANLSGSSARAATFANAVLDRARAPGACWREADLRGVRLDDALLTGIDLSHARLDGARLTRTILMKAKAPDSRWVGAHWHMCVAPSSDFTRACFDGATLVRSVLMDAMLVDSAWQGATLQMVYAGGDADWRRSRLSKLRATKCGWRGSRLAGACLQGATLSSCDFGDADLTDVDLRDAQLYRSLFMRTCLRGVDATAASFFQTLCRKADFTDAVLVRAILVQADMSEARMDGARLDGARKNQPVGVP